jgi:polysaccharide export outer membrane protein
MAGSDARALCAWGAAALPRLLACAALALAATAVAAAQEGDGAGRRHVPMTVEDVVRAQEAMGRQGRPPEAAPAPPAPVAAGEERERALAGAVRFSQDYILGAGDVVEVTVYGVEGLDRRELELDAAGAVTLPFLGAGGGGVALGGLTAREAEVLIAGLYGATVMRDPQVGLTVKEHRSQFVTVLGAVSKPGAYELRRRAFLLDALSMAGGLLPEKAEPKAVVQRAAGAGGAAAEAVEVDLVLLLGGGDAGLNVPVYAGDVVTVPEKVPRFFYVLGDVNRGGAFEMRREEAMTLTKALATAGGLMVTAKGKKAVVIRGGDGGVQIPVNVGDVLKGRSPDLELSGGDVVFIPGSTTKTIGRGLLGTISSAATALVYVGIRGY